VHEDFFYKLKILQLRGSSNLFDVKITDISLPDSPFILYKNLRISMEGYILFRPDNVEGEGD
jgi:hypothetical protein